VPEKPLTAEEEKEIGAALDSASESMKQLPDDFTYVTSSGAVIEAIMPPGNMMHRVLSQFPDPEPPMVEIKSGGKKWMEANVNDPVYITKRRRRMVLLGEAMMKLNMFKGMRIVQLPKGVPPYEEDDTWVEEYEAIGIEAPAESEMSARYIEWLRYRILPSSVDMDELRKASNRLQGIKEEDIEADMAQFLNPGGRDPDQGVD
jgi:hypothetical protein